MRINNPESERSLGRRDADFAYERLHIPSLIIDHTELMLRRAGVAGEEGFGIWAGTLADGDAFVSTLLIPAVTARGRYRGEISPETVARLLERLDHLDLVPLAQIHSHPRGAFLSDVDAERPILAVAGFLSAIIPDFAFVDLTDLAVWRIYEYRGPRNWHELSRDERQRRIVIDPSILTVS